MHFSRNIHWNSTKCINNNMFRTTVLWYRINCRQEALGSTVHSEYESGRCGDSFMKKLNKKHSKAPCAVGNVRCISMENSMQINTSLENSMQINISIGRKACKLTSAWRTVCKLNFRLLKINAVHELKPLDFEKRLHFCRWFYSFLDTYGIYKLDNTFFYRWRRAIPQ